MSSLLTRIKKRFPQGSFIRNVGILAGGTAFGQGLVLLASPVLSRLYTPDDFGVLAVYASILGVLAVIGSLRYEMAIPLPKDDKSAANILAVAMLLAVVTSATVALSVALFGEAFLALIQAPALRMYVWLLPLSVLLVTVYQVLSYWAVRKRAFKRIAQTKLSQGTGSVAAQLGLGLISFGPLGLIIGQVIGSAAGLGVLARGAFKDDYLALRQIRLSAVLAAAKRYKRFPKYATGGALLNSASSQLPNILLAALYGPQVVGWFFFTQRIVRTPLNLVSQSVSQVYYGDAAKLAASDPHQMLRLFKRTAKTLLITAIGPLFIALFISPWFFSTVFGAEWREAGIYTQLMVPYFLMQFVIAPISQTFSILERQHLLLLLNASKLTLSIAPIVFAHYLDLSATAAIGAFSTGMAINYTIVYFVSLKLINDRISKHMGVRDDAGE